MRFEQLDTLRYVFAAMIVAGHTCGWARTMPNGALAVDFFFVLSGFVLSHSILNKPTQISRFMVSRAARIFPLHIVTTGWICLLMFYLGKPPETWLLIKNFLLMQNVIPNSGLGINGPSWSISAEFWLNISMLYFLVTRRNVLLSIGVCVACLLLLIKFHPNIAHANKQVIFFTTAGILRCTAGLALGHIVYVFYLYLASKMKAVTSRRQLLVSAYTITEIALLAALVLFLFAKGRYPKWICFGLMPPLVLIMSQRIGMISNLLAKPALGQLGNLSFGIYLIHYPILFSLREFGILGTAPETPLYLAPVMIVVSSIIAIPVYLYVEKTSQRVIINAFVNRKS